MSATCDCQQRVLDEARRLLEAASRAERQGHRRNRDWCLRAAFGCARAWGVLRRAT